MFDESLFFPAFKAAGMLSTATDDSGAFDVGFNRPDTTRFHGHARSEDYEIEYRASDRPNLAEGDALTISGAPYAGDNGTYKVRFAPFVSDIPAQGTDGSFRRALLTRVS